MMNIVEGGYPIAEHLAKENILVCITANPASVWTIQAAHRLAQSLNASWMAVTVDTPDYGYVLSKENRQKLLGYMQLVESLGGATVRLFGQSVHQEIIRYAREQGVTHILIGRSESNRWQERFHSSLVHDLIQNSGYINVMCIASPETISQGFIMDSDHPSNRWFGYAVSLLAVMITTMLAIWGRHILTAPDLVMLFFLPIMGIAFQFGQGPALMTSTLSALSYNYYFIYPYFNFSLTDPKAVLTINMLFTVGIIISNLMNRIRCQELESRERERQTDALHRLTREVMTTLDDGQIAQIITRHAARLFGGEAAICLEDMDGNINLTAATPNDFYPLNTAMNLIRRCCVFNTPTGKGTDHLSYSELIALPIYTSRTKGALVLRIVDSNLLSKDQFFYESFAHQVSLAIDRAKLSEEVRMTAIRAKEEELRSTLLSMASHDLRTPLGAIIGAGTAIRDDQGGLDQTQQHELLETICSEAERMERLIGNLLDMVRLESGGCHLRKDWIPFEEMIGTTLVRLEKQCQGRLITVKGDEKIPMLFVDPVFFESVLVNLLDNAIKYTPAQSEITWIVERLGEKVVILLQDQGPGVPPGEEEDIFKKFVRGKIEGIPGSGLGLAICQGVIQAHDGTIQVTNRATGGAEFRLILPHPPLPQDIFQSEQYENSGGIAV
ncbi:MAG: DUF4118 domain-containing protein [Magnetococcus sp. DMHC-6]